MLIGFDRFIYTAVRSRYVDKDRKGTNRADNSEHFALFISFLCQTDQLVHFINVKCVSVNVQWPFMRSPVSGLALAARTGPSLLRPN